MFLGSVSIHSQENGISVSTDELIQNVEDDQQDLSQRRRDLILSLLKPKVAQGEIEPFTKDNYFRYTILEESLHDLLNENFYSREELVFLYPYEVVEEVDDHLQNIKFIISTHFINQYNLSPRTDVFRGDEISVLRGIKRLDSPSGLSLEYKLSKFLKEIQIEIFTIINILYPLKNIYNRKDFDLDTLIRSSGAIYILFLSEH